MNCIHKPLFQNLTGDESGNLILTILDSLGGGVNCDVYLDIITQNIFIINNQKYYNNKIYSRLQKK